MSAVLPYMIVSFVVGGLMGGIVIARWGGALHAFLRRRPQRAQAPRVRLRRWSLRPAQRVAVLVDRADTSRIRPLPPTWRRPLPALAAPPAGPPEPPTAIRDTGHAAVPETAPTVSEGEEPATVVPSTDILGPDALRTDLAPDDVAASDRLAWLRGADNLGDLPLNRVTTTIGSSEDADLVLDDPSVAPLHAVVRDRDGGWWVAAAAPCWVDGEPVDRQPRLLVDGGTLRLGQVRFSVFCPPVVVTGPDLCFRGAGQSVQGGRSRNEDAYYVDASLAVVADGVGGRPAGGLASRLAVDGIVGAAPVDDLEAVIRGVNEFVLLEGMADPRRAGMASTLDVVALYRDGPDHWVRGAHVGDGVVLLQRDGGVDFITHPHTLVSELVKAGQLSTAEGRSHPDRGSLMRGIGLARSIQPDHWQRRAEPGMRFVMATDGLIGALGERKLRSTLQRLRDRSPDTCVDELVRSAIRAGADDNVTVIVLDVSTLDGRGQPGGVEDGRQASRGEGDRQLPVDTVDHARRIP